MRKVCGLTLVEMIVVIAIFAALIAALVPVVINVIDNSKLARARAEVDALARAIMQLYKDTTFWPQDNDINTTTAWNDARNGLLGVVDRNRYPGWKGPYLEHSVGVDPWGNPYFYDGGGYLGTAERGPGERCVMSFGPNGADNNSRDRRDMQAQGDDIIYYFSLGR